MFWYKEIEVVCMQPAFSSYTKLSANQYARIMFYFVLYFIKIILTIIIWMLHVIPWLLIFHSDAQACLKRVSYLNLNSLFRKLWAGSASCHQMAASVDVWRLLYSLHQVSCYILMHSYICILQINVEFFIKLVHTIVMLI